MKKKIILISAFLLIILILSRTISDKKITTINSVDYFDYANYLKKKVDRTIPIKRVIKVGLIDGKVEEQHHALSTIKKIENSSISKMSSSEDVDHATSVLSVITQFEHNDNLYGIALGSHTEIYNASVLNKGVCKPEYLVEAIEYCLNNDVEIINISIAFKKFPQEIYKLFEIGRKKNVLFVFSNGNLDIGEKKLKYMDNVIFIGSTNQNFEISSMNSKNEAEYYFPGTNIFVASTSPNFFDTVNGTTYSAAIVTGFLIKKLQETSNKFELDYADLKDYLKSVELVYK